ncbi:MAG: homoaconitase, partial [Candidatus Eisenbacteria bacterium]|nr:homoaconitase [Candidatus Eisenbacteria bacterium]
MGQNRIEKIAERFAIGLPKNYKVRSGDFLTIQPAHVMTHDNTGAVIPKFKSIGATKIYNPAQPVYGLDHDVQNEEPENLAKYAKIEAFAKEHGIVFHPAKMGIVHQLMLENGFVQPGSFVVGSDSHSNIYGAVGALGTPVVRTDAAAIWATGRTWWQVPEIVKVNLEGRLRPGVTGKDVIIALIGYFNKDEVLNGAIEFDGDGLASLSMDQRMTISNMTTEWGALVGLIPYDETTRAFFVMRAEEMKKRGIVNPRLTPEIIRRFEAENPQPDPDAFYAKEFTFDLGSVTPHVAGPNEVKKITPLSEISGQKVKIHKAYLLSCVNGRLEDMAEAARVLKGGKVHPEVKLYVAAASAFVQSEAQRLGYWDILMKAGAIALPTGCGPCIGLGEGLLEPGEVAVSATNRNFKGRMGSPEAFAYLASPAVVAASAMAGIIAAPESMAPAGLRGAVKINAPQAQVKERIEIRDGFPGFIEGELLLVPKDNLNTDGIYGKDFTYKDNLTPEEMGRAAMLNYDPEFQNIVEVGDLLVGGWNFGSGSSREQAATALKYRGIQMVIAGSYSQT